MIVRTYKNCSRQIIATAYGYRKSQTIVAKIDCAYQSAPDEVKRKLGTWKTGSRLLPDQVEAIVLLLGKPETPHLLYAETIQ